MGKDRKGRRRRDQDGLPGAAFDILQRPSRSFHLYRRQQSNTPTAYQYSAKTMCFLAPALKPGLLLRLSGVLAKNKQKCLSLNNLRLKLKRHPSMANQGQSRPIKPNQGVFIRERRPDGRTFTAPGQTRSNLKTVKPVKPGQTGLTLATP
jgi:hypothetical protein